MKVIAPAPGERTVILVSPGFLSQSEQYTLDRIVDRALRSQIVIDSLDPKGLAILLRESDASRNTIILPDARASQARYHLDASKEFAVPMCWLSSLRAQEANSFTATTI